LYISVKKGFILKFLGGARTGPGAAIIKGRLSHNLGLNTRGRVDEPT